MVQTRSAAAGLQKITETENASVKVSSPETKMKKNQNGTKQQKMHPTIYIVFGALLLDLLAFTMILPLLPSLLDHYARNDGPNGVYHKILSYVQYFQKIVGAPSEFNSVLFGGFLGSMFSYLQFLASPLVGGLSDVYGRKPLMLICLVGIASSYLIWAYSRSFLLFILARFVGGLSKGNVSLSMAIIADVSPKETRGVGMALVGIAFSAGFIIGPVIGAAFAHWAHSQTGAWFVYPALFAFALSLADLLFIALCFKETLPKEKRAKSVGSSLSNASAYISIIDLFRFSAVKNLGAGDLAELRRLGLVYFVYLFLYSGLEFTLTFLTHHKFNYTSMQQGWMFFSIGLTMAILQGGFVRRVPPSRTKATAVMGLLLIIPSFISVGFASNIWLLYFGLLLFAVSTAMVVPCMMTLVSKLGGDHQKGSVMGIFRSLGALARAAGPILASIAYWSVGSSITYLVGGLLLIWPWYALRKSLVS